VEEAQALVEALLSNDLLPLLVQRLASLDESGAPPRLPPPRDAPGRRRSRRSRSACPTPAPPPQ
jgi:hypothetical protein